MNFIASANIYLSLFLVYNTTIVKKINKNHKKKVIKLFIFYKISARLVKK